MLNVCQKVFSKRNFRTKGTMKYQKVITPCMTFFYVLLYQWVPKYVVYIGLKCLIVVLKL